MLEEGEEEVASDAADAACETPAIAIATPAPEEAASLETPPEVPVTERFQRLFDELKIQKIIVVDDQLQKQLDGAFVVGILQASPAAAEAIQHFFPDIDLSPEADNLFDLMTAKLQELDANAKSDLGAALSQFEEAAADIDVPQTVKELAPADFDIEFLTPAQWAQQRGALLEECTVEARALFLFDQDLNGDGELSKGTQIIAGIAAENEAGFGTRWFCGLLTHTLKMGEEVSKWRELATEENLKLELFMPISKQNLSDGNAFYGAVYRTVINIYTEKMKALSKAAFEKALHGALEEFANLDPLDFEHMIVKSSEDEGVSELETVLRLYSIVQKDRVKTELLHAERLSNFLTAARTVKKVVDVGRALPDAASKRLARLRAGELYEPGDLINKFRDPLRNGDLFEIGSPGSLRPWVLIAQPCDLMVRSDGKRAYEENFKVAVLAPVKKGPLGDPPQTKAGLGFTLERFDHDGMQYAFVSFADATPVDLNVLDLTVLRTDGKCELNALEAADDSKFASLAWDERSIRLRDAYKAIAKKIEAVRKKDGDDRAKEVAGYVMLPAAPAAKFRKFGSYDKGKFAYKIRRSGRVREPFATSLLAAFSRYLARDANEHDFSAP